jgi:adenylosuccinate synthase
MSVDLLLGLQWGDEGKGKIVDVLTESYDIIARFQGGPNAGHTLEFEGIKHVLHTIPSGIFHPSAINLIGNGVVIDPVIFKKELENLAPYDIDFSTKLLISKKAHLILPTHRLLDAASEASKGKAKIGLTKSWKDRYRTLIQKHIKMLDFHNVDLEYDLNELETQFFESIETLKKCQIVDSENYLHNAQDAGKKILAEGAQGSLLDVDFGTYPFVTSSTTTAAGACTGLGVAPNKIKEVFGIFKAYTTRVGSGPFPTELFDEVGERIAKVGHEFGATTGRPRRCGWIDLVALKYAIRVNGVTQLMMMKGDVLSGIDTIKVCNQYKTEEGLINHFPFDINDESISPEYIEIPGWKEDLTQINTVEKLPKNFTDYIHFLERELDTPIKIVSVGPDRKQTILR